MESSGTTMSFESCNVCSMALSVSLSPILFAKSAWLETDPEVELLGLLLRDISLKLRHRDHLLTVCAVSVLGVILAATLLGRSHG